MSKRSRWYRLGQIAGLWRVAVQELGVFAGTATFALYGCVAIWARQALHDVEQVAADAHADAD